MEQSKMEQQSRMEFWKTVKESVSHNFWFYFLTIIAVGLIIASFLLPPTGIIDNSVLAAAGEIFAFAALGTLVHAIDKGKTARVMHGNTSLEVGTPNPEDKPEDYERL